MTEADNVCYDDEYSGCCRSSKIIQDLLEQVRQHATHEKRSFNKDVLWLLERALAAEEAQRPAARPPPP
jgi:hypothetical protein